MSDCLRLHDAVRSGKPFHLVVVHYIQDKKKKTKKIKHITEIDLTSSVELLFGNLNRSQLEELVKVVKSVPQKRKPTKEEHQTIYDIRNNLQTNSGSILLNIKCDKTQSRLQCSFNHFQEFIEKNPDRVVTKSNTNEFRGGVISMEISSGQRVFK